MSKPISATITAAASVLTPGMVVSRVGDGVAKGLETLADRGVDLGDRGLERIDLAEVETEQQALVSRQAATQGFDDLGARGPDPGADPAGEAFGIALALGQSVEDGAPARPHDVREHRAELEVGRLQEPVDPLHVRGLLPGQLLAGAGEVAQRLDRHRRHEAGADQAMRQQVGQPRRVVHVGLAAGHVLDVPRVGEHQLERLGQNRPDRLPVDAGRFHRHVGDRVAAQPARQPLEFRGRGAEGLDVPLDPATLDQASTGHDAVAMHVEPGATRMKDFHDCLLACGTGEEPTGSNSRMRAPAQAGVATGRGARRAPGSTFLRARSTKDEPTSLPVPPSG
jgi:hypothetical protein